jgi:hypothetical protein
MNAIKNNSDATQFIDPKFQYTGDEILTDIINIFPEFIAQIGEDLQTEPLCLLAVKQKGLMLKYVTQKYRTYPVILAAVSQNGDAVYYVENEKYTEQLLFLATKFSPKHFQLVSPKLVNPILVQMYHSFIKQLSDDSYNGWQLTLAIHAIKKDGSTIKLISEQTEELCLLAIKQSPFNIQHITVHTEKLCIEAASINGLVFSSLKVRTYPVCLAAVKQYPPIFSLIDKSMRTEELCMEAIKINGSVIQMIEKPTRNMMLEAINQNSESIRFCKEPDELICITAIKDDPLNLAHIPSAFQSTDICVYAVCKDLEAYKDVHNPSISLSLHFLRKNPEIIQYMSQTTLEQIHTEYHDQLVDAIKNRPKMLKHLKPEFQTPEVCIAAVKRNGHLLRHLNESQQITAVVLAAVSKNGNAIHLIKQPNNYTVSDLTAICEAAIKNNALSLKYVKKIWIPIVTRKRYELVLLAVSKNGLALRYIFSQTAELCLRAVSQNSAALRYCRPDMKTTEIVAKALEHNQFAKKYVNYSEPQKMIKLSGRTKPTKFAQKSGYNKFGKSR